ncbi:MAG: hypothetical protein ABIE55_03050 [Candidatus Aenigmatarchaeota archaeon]
MFQRVSTDLNSELFDKFEAKREEMGISSYNLAKLCILSYLNKHDDSSRQTIFLDILKPEIWTKFVEKCKKNGRESDRVIAELVYKWTVRNDFKVQKEK